MNEDNLRKLCAEKAMKYILLIDEQKLTKELNSKHFVSLGYVSKMVRSLGGEPAVGTIDNKDGYLITDDGNFILDIKFENIKDFK